MSRYIFANNAKTTSSGSFTAGATSLVVTDGTVFPTIGSGQHHMVTIISESDEDVLEVLKVTARATNTLTVVRAQEGTSDALWPSGSLVQLRPTAAFANGILHGLDQTSNALGTGAIDIQSGRPTGVARAATGDYAVALGYDVESSAVDTIAVGNDARATVLGGMAMGYSSIAYGLRSLVIGYNAGCGETDGIAIGTDASVSGSTGDIAIGHDASTSGGAGGAVALGEAASASAQWGVAVGDSASATSSGGVAVGRSASCTGGDGVALGANASNAIGSGVAIGEDATVTSSGVGVAIGYGAETAHADTIALGRDSYADTADSMALGASPILQVARSTSLVSAFAAPGIETIIAGPPVGLATPATWVTATAYTRGQCVIPSTPNGYHYYLRTAKGDAGITSGGTEPTWSTTPGGSNPDGDGWWICVDPTDIEVALPANTHFMLTAVGFQVIEADTVTVAPQASFGIDTSTTDVKAASAMTGIDTAYQHWWADTPALDDSAGTSLHAAVTTAATATTMVGRPIFKGYLVRDF